MSRGDCGLRKALGSLSADGWGYDPALLNVRLFVSVLALEPTGYWVVPGLGAKTVTSGRAHTGEYSLWPLLPVSLSPQVSHSRPMPPQETLYDPQLGLAHSSVESLLCPRTQCT